MKKSTFFLITLVCIFSYTTTNTSFEIGVLSDCQYCDYVVKWNRYYKKAQKRLQEAVAILNKDRLRYTIHLGDFIDKDFKSLDSLLQTWNHLKFSSYHVLGNNDFEVEDSLKQHVIQQFNLKNRYYNFVENDWRFIVLDGNDVSFFGTLTKDKKRQKITLFKKWNG